MDSQGAGLLSYNSRALRLLETAAPGLEVGQ